MKRLGNVVLVDDEMHVFWNEADAIGFINCVKSGGTKDGCAAKYNRRHVLSQNHQRFVHYGVAEDIQKISVSKFCMENVEYLLSNLRKASRSSYDDVDIEAVKLAATELERGLKEVIGNGESLSKSDQQILRTDDVEPQHSISDMGKKSKLDTGRGGR